MGGDQAKELAELTTRVATLERQVAELTGIQMATAPVVLRPTVAPVRVEPPPMPIAEPAVKAAGSQSLENRLGSQVFNMIGIVAIIVGTSWFLKLAIERGWLGHAARVIVGLAAGAGLVLWSERFRRKGFGAFSYSLKALGTAVLYLSLWASFQLYHQLPASVALAAMLLVTAWNGFMAWSQDAELLASYGLVGGFATPLLLSTGGDHETFLFTYIAAIDLALVLLLRWKSWHRLLLPAFAATVAYFIGYYARFFHTGPTVEWDGQSTETALFSVVFWAIFAVVSVRGFRVVAEQAGEVILPVLTPLADAAFLGCALYSVLQDSGLHPWLPWGMVALAAVYLGLMRVQASAVASAMHLAAAVVFLTVAIPLKASGHSLTVAWLVEGLVLYWVAMRFYAEPEDAPVKRDRLALLGEPSLVLTTLSACGFVLGLLALTIDRLWIDGAATFFNAALGSALVAIACLAGTAWLAASARRPDTGVLAAALIGINLVAVLLTLREVIVSQFDGLAHAAFANAEFGTALVGLAVLAACAWAGYRLRQPAFGGVTLVVFNLLAILSVEREIGALWPRDTANLQRSLAISGFLMGYGAALLAAGFWRRSAFVRWQALVLLLFTIAKVFLYDIGGLSQGYRVASFLGLGALLLAVSFAYQKDWLGLKTPASGEDRA